MRNKFLEIDENKRFKIFGVEFYYLWLLGILFALFGWIAENVFKIIDDGFIDSRFHLLPFIGIYALVPFAVHIALGDPDDLTLFGFQIFKKTTIWTKVASNIICFLIISLFVFLGELAVGNIYEYFFDVILWDYTNMFGHFTRYTCVLSTFMYGAIAYLFFRFIFKPLINLFKNKIPYKVAMYICLILGSLLIIDDLRLVITIIVNHEAPQFWKLVFYTK